MSCPATALGVETFIDAQAWPHAVRLWQNLIAARQHAVMPMDWCWIVLNVVIVAAEKTTVDVVDAHCRIDL